VRAMRPWVMRICIATLFEMIRGDQELRGRGVPLSEAISDSVPLSALLAQARLSRSCLELVRPLLGDALASQLRPGPIDGGIWTVLADNGQAAAKARQIVPLLERALSEAGMPISGVRPKVSPFRSPAGG
jgi:hypothetical protein